MYTTSSTSRAIVAEFSKGYTAPSGGDNHMRAAVYEYLKVSETEKISVAVSLPERQVETFQNYVSSMQTEHSS